MNDYWNDPPEQPDVPECCNETMWLTFEGGCICKTCGNVIAPPKDEPQETADVKLPDNYLKDQPTP